MSAAPQDHSDDLDDPMRPPSDADLIQIVDAALADATRRSGAHLVCHPGCTPCCEGVFAISALDAARLQDGLRVLTQTDPARASRVHARIVQTVQRLAADFPGDPASGHLATDDASQARFEDFANDEPCPVLDPTTGTCDLYAHRPMTCRVFGPPVQSGEGLGICELSFTTASESEIAAAEMHLPGPALEAQVTAPLGDWTTIVAFSFQQLARTAQLESPTGSQAHSREAGLP